MSRSVNLQTVPKFGPGAQLEAVRPQRALFHGFQRTVVGLQIGIIHIGIKPQVEHSTGPIHHVELAACRVGTAHIHRLREEDHPTEMLVKPRVADGGDFVPLAFVIPGQADRTKVVPILCPTGFQILCVNRLQFGIARGVDFDVVMVEGTELCGRGMIDPHGVAQLEVVHRWGAIREMQRRSDVEMMCSKVVIGRLRINDDVP